MATGDFPDVRHPVVIVVVICVVTQSIAIRVDRLGGVPGECIAGIRYTVCILVGIGGIRIGGNLEPDCIQTAGSIRRSCLVDFDAAGFTLADTDLRVGKIRQFIEDIEFRCIGHHGGEVTGFSMTPGPDEGTALVLFVGMTQPHVVADLMDHRVVTAFIELNETGRNIAGALHQTLGRESTQ